MFQHLLSEISAFRHAGGRFGWLPPVTLARHPAGCSNRSALPGFAG